MSRLACSPSSNFAIDSSRFSSSLPSSLSRKPSTVHVFLSLSIRPESHYLGRKSPSMSSRGGPSRAGWKGNAKPQYPVAAGPSRPTVNNSKMTPTRGGAAASRGRGGGGRGAAASGAPRRGGQQAAPSSASAATATAVSNSRLVEMVEISDDDDNAKNSTRNNLRKRPRQQQPDSDEEMDGGEEEDDDQDEDEATKKTVPPELLTRLLHEFFEQDSTRITRDANDAVAKYVDVFVREAIARAAIERGAGGGFLEVCLLSTSLFPFHCLSYGLCID